MAYVELHQSLYTHRKLLRLARLLNMEKYAVAGRLGALWCWALDNAPDGFIRATDADLLADVMGWEGDTDTLIRPLITAGFLEEEGALYVLHDWHDYAGRLIEQRRMNAEKQRAWRQRNRSESAATPSNTATLDSASPETKPTSTSVTNAETAKPKRAKSRNRNVTVTSPVTLPSRDGATVPYRTIPNHDNDDHSESESDPHTFAAATPQEGADGVTSTKPAGHTLWDALVQEFGYEPVTKVERSRWGKVVKDLKAVNATPEQVHERCQRHRDMLEAGAIHWTLTPMALVAHWGELGQTTPPVALVNGYRRTPPLASASGRAPVNSGASRAYPPAATFRLYPEAPRAGPADADE